MRFLFLSHEYPPVGGGGATACRNLAEAFARAGHEVCVVTGSVPSGTLFRGASVDPAAWNQEGAPGHVNVIRVNSRRRYADHCSFPEMLDFLLKACRITEQLQAEDPFDLCLAFYGIPAGPAARRLKKRYGLPYVVRIGGGDIPGFQDRFRVLYHLFAPVVRIVWKDADALTVNSRGLKKMAHRFSRTDKFHVIPNGVDAERFFPAAEAGKTRHAEDTEGTGKPVRLLTVSRLLKRKGIGEVISRLSEAEERSGRKLFLTIAGSGPFEQELKKLAARSDAASRIRFTGWVTREALPGLYRQADIFLCPSFREGMPNTVLEAMASGLPVVMRKRCPGAEELVRGNGVLAEGSYTDALVQILELDRADWREMGAAGRVLAESGFSCQRTGECYLRLFRKIIGKQKG